MIRLQVPTLARKCDISHWFSCRGHGRLGRAGWRAVTGLPKFLGWMDYQIFLTMELRSRPLRARVELRYHWHYHYNDHDHKLFLMRKGGYRLPDTIQRRLFLNIQFSSCILCFRVFLVSIAFTSQMLCAGVENTILSGCHGDSGGPYVCLNADGKTYTLHGAVSWGSGRCDAKQLFTVFARVTQFRAWIKTHTGLGGGGGGDLTTSICS